MPRRVRRVRRGVWRVASASLLAIIAACHGQAAQAPPVASIANVTPIHTTETLPDDPDDPAIWLNPADASKSLVFGTVKVAAPAGALAVFDLSGHLLQLVKGPDRPNNVDVEYGIRIGGVPTDIVVLTERLGRCLRVYGVQSDGRGVREIAKLPILLGAPDDEGAPMGIGLYKRPRDGAIFAIVAPKAGPSSDHLWQYRIDDDGRGSVRATLVRRFGAFSGQGETEAVVVDDALGYVYYADEDAGIHKWHADPDAADASRELAFFATTGYEGDREGLGIYARADGTGFIASIDQMPGDSTVHLYRREGEPGRPNDHSKEVATFHIGADGTDGLEVSSSALGHEFARGLLVAMNSASRNFLLVSWSDVIARLGLTP